MKEKIVIREKDIKAMEIKDVMFFKVKDKYKEEINNKENSLFYTKAKNGAYYIYRYLEKKAYVLNRYLNSLKYPKFIKKIIAKRLFDSDRLGVKKFNYRINNLVHRIYLIRLNNYFYTRFSSPELDYKNKFNYFPTELNTKLKKMLDSGVDKTKFYTEDVDLVDFCDIEKKVECIVFFDPYRCYADALTLYFDNFKECKSYLDSKKLDEFILLNEYGNEYGKE